ncbi:hypothetical protein F140042L4_28410 [Coprococcus phoceensis]
MRKGRNAGVCGGYKTLCFKRRTAWYITIYRNVKLKIHNIWFSGAIDARFTQCYNGFMICK